MVGHLSSQLEVPCGFNVAREGGEDSKEEERRSSTPEVIANSMLQTVGDRYSIVNWRS